MKRNRLTRLRQMIAPLKDHSFGSVFFQNLFLLSVLIMVPMLLAVCIVAVSYHTFAEKEIALYSNRTISFIQNSVQEMVEDCLQQSNNLLADDDIYLYMVTPAENEYTFYRNDFIYKFLKTQLQSKDYLESIYIYSAVNHQMVSNYGELKLDKFFDMGWYDHYKNHNDGLSFYYAFRDGTTRYLQPIKILSLYKELIHGNERKGVVVYNINFNRFTQQLSDLRNEYDIGLSLLDAHGKKILTVWGEENTPEQLEIAKQSESGYWQTKNTILYKSPINYTDIYLYSSISSGAISDSLRGPLRIMMWIIAGGLLLVIGLTLLISVRIYHPFRKILDELATPAGLMAGHVSISGSEEEFILSTIRGVFKENEKIAEELSQRVSLLKQAQSVALQSQINPHFLHNTLDSISWTTMRLFGGKNEASVMLTKLAQMLRYSLDDVDTLVSLGKELDNTRVYIELQAIRYKNSFKVVWEIQEEVLPCHVIKLMIQPLIENAIQHGLKSLKREGLLRISAYAQDDTLKIEVWDNGTGIPPQRMAELQKALTSDMIRERDSIGIVNVHQRIQLFYGERYGVNIDTGNGTRVVLQLPFLDRP